MIGWMIAALGAKKQIWHITVGNSGASYGWSSTGTTWGSIAPDVADVPIDITGGTISKIYTVTTGGADITVISDTAGLLQTAFTTLYVYDGAAWRTYTTATADVFSNSGQTLWSWGDGTSDVFDNTSGGEIRGVYID
jgi:hypothetical protein